MRLSLRAAGGATVVLAALALAAFVKRQPPATPYVPPPPSVVPRAGFAAPAALEETPSLHWNAGTIYFMLTDRFLDADTANDHALGRRHDGAVLRSFEGGDFKGVLQKINEGWFDSLGVTAIWMTPFVEQIHGFVDEGQGKTWAYHGYWTRDWTSIDPAYGTALDLHALVDAAHRHGIRVLMDAVLNHTGPVTPDDPAWPSDWVRSGPNCTYRSYETTTACNLVATLPDIITESDSAVALPAALADKWRAEGRLEREQASLDQFFRRTGYPRAPKYYLVKWLTDWVRAYGLDGYRVDTAKHFGEAVSVVLRHEADIAYADWRRGHPGLSPDTLPFYMVGEVFGYSIGNGRQYNFGDRSVDFFANGYDALINFSFKSDATHGIDTLFEGYSEELADQLKGKSVLNYVDSHDDGYPYDLHRADPLGAGTRLLLAPGGAQIYYGDETARPLIVPGAITDANLRGLMNWDQATHDSLTRRVLFHWRRLGQFRKAHPAVGAGVNQMLQARPLVVARTLDAGAMHDHVVIGLGQPAGFKTIPVGNGFADGTPLRDAYSGENGTVANGTVSLTTPGDVVLLEPRRTGRRGREPHDPVTIEVVNNFSAPMEIFAYGQGTSYRLGQVDAGMRGHFQLRPAMLTGDRRVEFAIVNEPIVHQRALGMMLLSPGDIVDITIGTQILGSNAVIRP